jgi:hypothetical protein
MYTMRRGVLVPAEGYQYRLMPFIAAATVALPLRYTSFRSHAIGATEIMFALLSVLAGVSALWSP